MQSEAVMTIVPSIMLIIILSFAVGFVAGALVFRNNAAKSEFVVQAGKKAAEAAKQVIAKKK
jgi:hypothetical protein